MYLYYVLQWPLKGPKYNRNTNSQIYVSTSIIQLNTLLELMCLLEKLLINSGFYIGMQMQSGGPMLAVSFSEFTSSVKVTSTHPMTENRSSIAWPPSAGNHVYTGSPRITAAQFAQERLCLYCQCLPRDCKAAVYYYKSCLFLSIIFCRPGVPVHSESASKLLHWELPR